MLRYLVWRFFWVVPQIILVSAIAFIAMSITPGDPVLMMLGPEAHPKAIEKTREELGLHLPLYEQYLIFLGNACRGDLGISYMTKRPVTKELCGIFPFTLELAVASFSVAALLGIPLGILSAIKSHSFVDNLIRILSIAWFSIPVFWSGLMLILVFSVYLKWFPSFGAGSFSHLVLPGTSLALVSVGMLARMTRSSVLEVLAEEYVKTARAKGLKERRVIFKHVFKNAMVSVVTILGLQFSALLGGAVLTESVFARPGVGRFLVDAIFARDYPAIKASIILVAMIVILVNLLTDLVYFYLDPTIKYS